MSVSPLSRGPRTLTEGDVLAVAAALAPTIAAELTATRADLEGLVASTVRPERRALSVDEFATAWGVSASTVRRAIDERRIPAMRLTVGGSIRIPADATPPVDWPHRITGRERDTMTDRDLHPAAQAEALRRADAAMFDRLIAAAFNGDQTGDDRRLAEHRDSLAEAIGDLWSSGSPAVRVVADRLDDLASAVASLDMTDTERATCVDAVIAIIGGLAPEVVA